MLLVVLSLTNGKEFWDTDSPSHSDAGSIYSGSHKSSSPRREVDEEEYMKIVVSKRIRRLRRTIYEDPGNPFLIFDFEEQEISENDAPPSSFWKPDADDAPPPGFWGPGDVSPAFSGPSRHASTKHEFDSILGGGSERRSPDVKDARDSPIHAPTPQRIGTPALIKDHSIPAAGDVQHQNFGGTHQGSVSQKQLPAPAAAPSQNAGSRDTAFYGFYDNVLQEYRQSMNGL